MAKEKEARESTASGTGQGEQAMQTTGKQSNQDASQQRGLSTRGSTGLSPFSSPFTFMRRFSEEMDRLFEDFGFGGSLLGPVARNDLFRGALSGAEQSLWSPQVEIFEREGQLVVRADLPGLTKDDVKVEVTDKFITISGERRQEHKENREGYYHTERSYGSFLRTVALPEGANAEDAKATFRNGVLEITLQAPQRAKGGRRVEISDGTEEHSQAQAARGAK